MGVKVGVIEVFVGVGVREGVGVRVGVLVGPVGVMVGVVVRDGVLVGVFVGPWKGSLPQTFEPLMYAGTEDQSV